jgi:site-specific DNA recombinase
LKKALSYARVSSKEQEQGYSRDAQVRTLSDYAGLKSFRIVKEFKYSESAKNQGRKHFNAMLDYLRTHTDVRVVLVEKTDRLCRNLKDYVLVESLVEELGLEIHLIKEGQVIRPDSRSQDRLIQGMFAILARNYILNMQEEILKGQIVKAEKGQYPGRALFGYAHDRTTRTIVEHPTNAAIARLMFQLYATGMYSAASLKQAIHQKTGTKLSKSHIHRLLTNRFYLGFFEWRKREYRGIHPPLVDFTTFDRVQEIISGRNVNKRRPHGHRFAFAGLLTCSIDNCRYTAELHKRKYIHYHCSFAKGKHKAPYINESSVSEMLGAVLRPLALPMDATRQIIASLQADAANNRRDRRLEMDRVSHQLSAVRDRMRRAYRDKLDGTIDESFWKENMKEWSGEETQLHEQLVRLESPATTEQHEKIEKILELAQIAHSTYLMLDHREQGNLLRIALSNCKTDGANLWPAYRKPFDLIVERAKNEEWRRGRDSNPR